MEKKTPSPRLTTEIKQFFLNECNLTVRASKGVSKNPFYSVRLEYRGKDEFPFNVRLGLLRAIYGEKEFIQRGSAGNIDLYSLAFHEKEWHAFKTEYFNTKNIPVLD